MQELLSNVGLAAFWLIIGIIIAIVLYIVARMALSDELDRRGIKVPPTKQP